MSRRKGELSATSLDRIYPHQVAIDAGMLLGTTLVLSHLYPSIAPRHINVRFSDHWYSICCFSSLADAERFRQTMHGVMTSPQERGRGEGWINWQPAGAPPSPPQWEDV